MFIPLSRNEITMKNYENALSIIRYYRLALATHLNKRIFIRLKLVLILPFLFSSFLVFSQIPKSDFSHIGIVIDSTDFQSLITNSFIRDSLGVCAYDLST